MTKDISHSELHYILSSDYIKTNSKMLTQELMIVDF